MVMLEGPELQDPGQRCKCGSCQHIVCVKPHKTQGSHLGSKHRPLKRSRRTESQDIPKFRIWQMQHSDRRVMKKMLRRTERQGKKKARRV